MGPREAVTVDTIDVTTVGGAQQSVAIVDSALKYVDSHRAELGAFQTDSLMQLLTWITSMRM